jgi:hypothetical protein
VTQLQAQRDGHAPTTRLSRQIGKMPKISAVLGLAWRSLSLTSIMLFAGSCIVADPPEYRAPGQTRPVLNTYSAVPTQTQALILDASSGQLTKTTFTIQVRSEDAGEPLRAVLFLDYQMKPTDPQHLGEQRIGSLPVTASTYDNVGRFISFDWPLQYVTGCHFVTLVVAHQNSFLDVDDLHLDPRDADDDAALVTWTVNVVRSSSDDTTIASCPTREIARP